MAKTRIRTTTAPDLDARFPVPLRGCRVDDDTRCAHYDGPTDVVAIRFACCNVYYPCYRCHREGTEHDAVPWPIERRYERAVLCGACRHVMSAEAYLHADYTCPRCTTNFNPACARHHDRYFAFA